MNPAPGARSEAATRIGLALLIGICLLLAASTWRVYSHTWDEPEHLAAGMQLLDLGRYEYDTEHPPIARVFIALGPYLAGARSYGTPPPIGVQEGMDILYGSGHYTLYLTLARLGTLPFLALLLVAAWLWARRVTSSDAEALLGVLLLASVPPILGHAALATLDVPAAATTLLALYLLQAWVCDGGYRNCILAGLATGVAVGTKLSAVPFIGLGAFGLCVIHAMTRWRGQPQVRADSATLPVRLLRRAGGAMLITAAALLPILIAYGRPAYELTYLPARYNWVFAYLLQDHAAVASAVNAIVAHARLPEGLWDFAEGIAQVKAHNDAGHVSFLLGELRSGGWWYFYLVALVVKTPIPLLLTGPAGLALMAREGWRERNAWRLAPLVLFTTLLAFASLYSHINIGIRHVLVLYPFMALGGAYLLAWAWRSLDAIRAPPARALAACGVLGLVAWQVSSLWTARPDYLPYFNEAVEHPEHVLVDSDLDWGQDLGRLERRLAQLKVSHLSLAYLGTADLAREPLPSLTLLEPQERATGWIAVTALAREHYPQGYIWLDAFRPVQRVGKTIDLYYLAPGSVGSSVQRRE